MKLAEFNYRLPPELVAQRPLTDRDASRLLLLDRRSGTCADQRFRELPELLSGNEVLVVNNTKVFPARLLGRRRGLGAEAVGRRSRARRQHLQAPIEVLLLRPLEEAQVWEALVRPGRKVRTGERLTFAGGEIEAEVLARGAYGLRTLRLSCAGNLAETLDRVGRMPLPPYIDRADEPDDRDRYQTVFASRWGAVAAPTAGLHFTRELLARLQARGVEIVELTLTIGLATFQPIHTAAVEDHPLRPEPYEISLQAAAALEAARSQDRPLVAVGTSVVRALESVASRRGEIEPGSGEADLFIYPGYRFRVVDQLLTNFHLPQSSLLLLVCAFGGRDAVLGAYRHAVAERYRFYSYGDCMLIR